MVVQCLNYGPCFSSAGDQLPSAPQPDFTFGDRQSVDFAALAASNATGGFASGFTQSKPGRFPDCSSNLGFC